MNGAIFKCQIIAGLESCRFTELTKDFPVHFHSHYLVGCLTSGNRILQTGKREYALKPFEIVVLNPWQAHTCRGDGQNVSAWSCIHISQKLMADILQTGKNSPKFNTVIHFSSGLANSFMELMELLQTDQASASEKHLLNLLRTLWLADKSIANAGRTKYIPANPKLENLREIIGKMPEASISLEDMAKLTGLSRYSMLRKFSEFTGLTPWRYLELMRLEKAKNMLKSGYGIADCALASGFHDQSHFHKNFKKCLGITPGIYRKAYIGAGDEA